MKKELQEEMKYVKPVGGTELDGRHPMELVGRMLLVKNLKEIGAKKVAQLVDEIRCGFVKKVPVENDTNNITTTFSYEWMINYEFAIFEATDDQWENLMSNFMQNVKANPLQEHLMSKN